LRDSNSAFLSIQKVEIGTINYVYDMIQHTRTHLGYRTIMVNRCSPRRPYYICQFKNHWLCLFVIHNIWAMAVAGVCISI